MYAFGDVFTLPGAIAPQRPRVMGQGVVHGPNRPMFCKPRGASPVVPTLQVGVQHFMEFGKPIGPVDLVILGTHSNSQKMRVTRKHTAEAFGWPMCEADTGMWISTDARNSGLLHFTSRQRWYRIENTAAGSSQAKAFATRSNAEGFLFEG